MSDATFAPSPRIERFAGRTGMRYAPNLDRAALNAGAAIAQMADDLRGLEAAQGSASQDDLTTLGWSKDQVNTWGSRARDRAYRHAAAATDPQRIAAAREVSRSAAAVVHALYRHARLLRSESGGWYVSGDPGQRFRHQEIKKLVQQGYVLEIAPARLAVLTRAGMDLVLDLELAECRAETAGA